MNWARIAGFIILAYVVFTTMKGNLRKWLQIIGLKPDDGSRVSGNSLSDTVKGLNLNALKSQGFRGMQ